MYIKNENSILSILNFSISFVIKNQIKSTINDNKPSPSSASPTVAHLLPVLDTSEMDPELAQYLSKHYQRANPSSTQDGIYQENSQEHLMLQQSTTQPSAPIYASSTPSDNGTISINTLKSGVNSDFNVPGKSRSSEIVSLFLENVLSSLT